MTLIIKGTFKNKVKKPMNRAINIHQGQYSPGCLNSNHIGGMRANTAMIPPAKYDVNLFISKKGAVISRPRGFCYGVTVTLPTEDTYTHPVVASTKSKVTASSFVVSVIDVKPVAVSGVKTNVPDPVLLGDDPVTNMVIY